MVQQIRGGSAAVSPMPRRLDRDAWFRVSDDGGRIVRQEALRAGTDLRDRLAVAHANYQSQGWTVGELRSGQWAFMVHKGDRRLMVAIRETPAVVAPESAIGASHH
jgi:hypothetical protein